MPALLATDGEAYSLIFQERVRLGGLARPAPLLAEGTLASRLVEG